MAALVLQGSAFQEMLIDTDVVHWVLLSHQIGVFGVRPVGQMMEVRESCLVVCTLNMKTDQLSSAVLPDLPQIYISLTSVANQAGRSQSGIFLMVEYQPVTARYQLNRSAIYLFCCLCNMNGNWYYLWCNLFSKISVCNIMIINYTCLHWYFMVTIVTECKYTKPYHFPVWSLQYFKTSYYMKKYSQNKDQYHIFCWLAAMHKLIVIFGTFQKLSHNLRHYTCISFLH